MRGHVRVEVGGRADLVQQLSSHRAGRDEASGPVVLGDDAAAVGRDLGDREAGMSPVGDLVQEAVVAAGRLRPTLDDMTGHHGAGEGLEVVAIPDVPPRGRAGYQARVGDARQMTTSAPACSAAVMPQPPR